MNTGMPTVYKDWPGSSSPSFISILVSLGIVRFNLNIFGDRQYCGSMRVESRESGKWREKLGSGED